MKANPPFWAEERFAIYTNLPEGLSDDEAVHVWYACGVGVESLIWRRLWLRVLSVSSGLLCNFVEIYLTFV